MGRKRHTPEQIIRKLREAEIALAQGALVHEWGDAAAFLFMHQRPNEECGLKLIQPPYSRAARAIAQSSPPAGAGRARWL